MRIVLPMRVRSTSYPSKIGSSSAYAITSEPTGLRLGRALVAGVLVLLSLATALVHAGEIQVPSPAQSSCPSAVTLSGRGNCCFDVIVRDVLNNPIAGSTVVVSFGGCPVTFCPTQPAGLIVDVPTNSARVTTDALGKARFCICATIASANCTATIYADGVLLCTKPVQTCDRIIRNITPAPWQAADVQWIGDVSPHNKVDDAIDAGSGSFEIVVNYNRCVTDDDVAQLLAMSPGAVLRYRNAYISSITVGPVLRANVFNIAALPQVAFIEQYATAQYHLAEAIPTMCVTPGSPSCACNVRTAYGLDGAGRTIVIIDSGVDNQTHAAFAATTLVAGVDLSAYPTISYTDPDDVYGHGTHVASIALGQGTANHGPGVAPAARLVDIGMGYPIPLGAPEKALEIAFNNAAAWSADVINISSGKNVASDGIDSYSQMVDLAESMNIVIVASVGNDGPSNTFIGAPGAATRALTVGGSDDLGTTNRADDGLYYATSKGPRSSDSDQDHLDELKPDVVAPGMNITAAAANTANGGSTHEGSSMAAPMVAGLVALIRQYKPSINAASIKQAIVSTAEAHGSPTLPGVDPVWNNFWGWGLVDACSALNLVASGCDVGHPNYPANPGWASVDISTSSPPAVGQLTMAQVNIKNFGSCQANGVRVHFGVHVYSAATPTFHDIGTKIVNIAPGATMMVSVPWVPLLASHQCLKTEVGWGPDTYFDNNTANRNLTVAMSPIHFTVKNILTENPATIRFETTIVPSPGSPPNWTIQLIPPEVTLGANDCEQTIQGQLTPPPGTPPGASATAHVTAKIGNTVIGGISFVDTVDAAPAVPATSSRGMFALIVLTACMATGQIIRLRKRGAQQ